MNDLTWLVAVLALALATLLPTAVWFGIRIGREESDQWWERRLLGSEELRPTAVRMLLAARRVTR